MQKSGPYVKGTNDLNESRSMSTTKVIGEGGGVECELPKWKVINAISI